MYVLFNFVLSYSKYSPFGIYGLDSKFLNKKGIPEIDEYIHIGCNAFISLIVEL